MRLLTATSTHRDVIKTTQDAFNASKLHAFARASWRHVPQQIFVMNQVHGKRVRTVYGSAPFRKYAVTDALITTTPNTMIVVKTADCVPVVAYDQTHGVLGIAHAGWRGTRSHIVKKLLERMVMLGATKKDITVTLGPSIQRCCYTVSPQRAHAFCKAFGPTVVSAVESEYHLDLPAAITVEATHFGISARAIRKSAVCTSCSKPQRYCSYRKGDRNVFITAVMFIS